MAHAITALRLLAVVPAAWAFSQLDHVSAWVLALIMVVAIVSDLVDGKVARRTGSVSARGMLFDHSTDCLFVTAGLAGAATAGVLPVLLPVLVPVAFGQYVLDSYLLHRQRQLRMSSLGRWNGVFYFAPLVMIAIAVLDVPLLSELARVLVRPCAVLLALSTVASIVDRALAPVRASAVAGAR